MARPETPDILAGLGQGSDDSLAAAIGPQVMALNITAVRLDGGTQPRAGIDQAVVEDYANDMEANRAEFPPVQVVYDGAEYWLWDGFHRLHARKRNGLYTVPAIVRQGTRRDAVLLSVGANATHGFRRTNEDKRRAVMALLHDEEWRQWSDREIARRCAVSNQFVSNMRAELSVNDGQIETRRVVRNGTEYTMTPPQRSAAPAVASQAANYATPDELDAAVRSWLVAYDTHDEKEAALVEVMELGENSITFDDLREWIGSVKPRRSADLIQAAGRVLMRLRQGVVNERAAPRVAEPFVPVDVEQQVEVEPHEIAIAAHRPKPTAAELASAVSSRLRFLWARANGGDTALRALLDELEQPGFPYVGSKEQWRNFETWYKQTYNGKWQPSMWDVREVLRKIAPAEIAPAEIEPAQPAPAFAIERKAINFGRTIKLWARCAGQGTMTVTVDSNHVHFYSPGADIPIASACDLLAEINDAITELKAGHNVDYSHTGGDR